MQCLIIAGGRVDSEQLKNVYRTMENVYVITCDRGTLYALEEGIPIDRAIGDFDSVSDEEFAEIKKLLEKMIPTRSMLFSMLYHSVLTVLL